MFIAEAITILHWGATAVDWGSRIATLIHAVNWASERWGVSISLTNSAGEGVRIGSGDGSISAEEGARRMGLEPGVQAGPAASKPATLGVVLLGASEFPYMQNLDNAAFKRSAQLFKSLFDPKNLTFKNTAVLDLFDAEMAPHELTQSIMDFIDKHSLTMKDIVFYYCGHGDYLPGQIFYLTLRTTKNAQKATTGLKPFDLRQDLDTRFADKRVYLIFDCCYASAASGIFMSGEADHGVRERIAEGFPAYGTALFAAAPRDMAALAPEGEEFTMFTGALADVIRDGAPGQEERLSLQDLKGAVRHRIFQRFGVTAVNPELHVPRQKAGDISTLPLFLNKAPKSEQKVGKPQADPQEPSDVEAAIATAGQHLKSESVPFRKTAVAELARLYSLTSNEALRTRIKELIEGAADDDSRAVQEEAKKYLLQIAQLEKRAAKPGPEPRKSSETRMPKPERLIHAFTGHSKAVTSVAFSPQSHLILSGSADKSIKLWHTEGDWQKPHIQNNKDGIKLHVGPVNAVAFSPDGNTIAAGGVGSIFARLTLFDISNPERSKPHVLSRGPIDRWLIIPLQALATFFMFLHGFERANSWQQYWDIPVYSFLFICMLLALFVRFINEIKVTNISFSSDGSFLLSSLNRKTFGLWEVRTKKRIKRFHNRDHSLVKKQWWSRIPPISCVAYSSNGRFALAGDTAGDLTLWSIATGEELITLRGHTGAVNSVAFSKDSKLAVSGSSDKTLKLWDMASRRELLSCAGHDGAVTSVAFSPDGRYVLSGSLDGTLSFWETNTGREILTIPAHSFSVRSVAISANGRFAASGGDDKMLKLWDVSGL
ncbi:MAG: caspase family protein [Rhodomicrobium sp.]